MKRIHGWSHNAQSRIENRSKKIMERCDLGIDASSDEFIRLKEISPMNARKLERGTGRLRKCYECGIVFVMTSKYKASRVMCSKCRGFVPKYFHKDNRQKEIYDLLEKIYNDYFHYIHKGVTITKLKK